MADFENVPDNMPPKKKRKVREMVCLCLDGMPECIQLSIYCFLFPSDLSRCASVSKGVKEATDTRCLWGKFFVQPFFWPKSVFLRSTVLAKPRYLMGDRKAMNLCLMSPQLQLQMAQEKALSFLTAGLISLPQIIDLWDESRQLFFNLLKNGYATEEWKSGQVTLAQLKMLWYNPPGDHTHRRFYNRYQGNYTALNLNHIPFHGIKQFCVGW